MPPSFGQPEAVPASTGPTLELMSMWAVEAEPRMGGPLMKALAAAVPLTGLQHLKRVRKQGGGLQVLLCRVDWRQQAENDDQQLGGSQAASAAQQQGQPQADGSGAGEAGSPTCNGAANGASGSSGGQAPDLPPAAADIVQQHSLQLFIAQVPLHAPITREQLVEWGKHWPMTWRCPDASNLPHLIDLSDAEVASMQRHMAAAWQLAAGNGAAGGVANACVIVDPQRDVAIAQAADCSHAHPLQHAAMAAVAAASEWQLRVWPEQAAGRNSSGGAPGGAAAADGAAALDGTAAALDGTAAAPAHAGLVHAASGQLDAADGKRRRLEGSADVRGAAGTAGAAATNGQDGAAAGGVAHAAAGGAQQGVAAPASCAAAGAAPAAAGAAPAAAAAAAAAEGDPGPRPYLCTGYDAYLLHEPCVMCAMALVHSRLRRVIYCVPDAQRGALGGALKLHSQRILNHRYSVWRLPLASDGSA